MLRRAHGRGSTLPAAVLLLAATPAAAEKRVEFNPEVRATAGYTDNLEFVAEQQTEDRARIFTLVLPVVKNWDSGSLSFRYRPSHVAHRNVSDLDRWEHRVNLSWNEDFSRRTSMGISARYWKTQTETDYDLRDLDTAPSGEDVQAAAGDPTLFTRTERQVVEAELTLTRHESERWDWNFGLAYGDNNHDRFVSGLAPGEVPVEDRTESGTYFSFSRSMSRAINLGARVDYRYFDLQFTGEEQVASASLTYDQSLGRNLTIAWSLGVAQTRDSLDIESTDIVGGFDLNRTFRRMALAFRVDHRPQSGGNIFGTSTDSSVGLSLQGTPTRDWSWSVLGAYYRRSPSLEIGDPRDTVVTEFSVERRFLRVLGVELGLNSTNQIEPVEVNVFRVGLSFVWYPLGPGGLRT